MPYDFTNDWFEQNVPVWTWLLPSHAPRRILEIGCYEGRSTCFIIEHCPDLAEIVCIDTWQGGIEHDRSQMTAVEERFDANVAEAIRLSDRTIDLRKMKDESYLALASLISNRELFDLIYIDGSHQAPDVLSDAVQSFHLLRRDGLMIFDDYNWRPDITFGYDILKYPKISIDAFVNIFHKKLVLYRHNLPLLQLYLRKTSD